MKSLFDVTTNAEIINRLNNLTQFSKPLWGKMTVEQMLAHLELSFHVNFGTIELKRSFILSTFFKGLAHKILLGNKNFPKHLPADKKIISKVPTDFTDKKQKVILMIKKYVEEGSCILSENQHNILGKISHDESAQISYKHIDHHLRQFGV